MSKIKNKVPYTVKLDPDKLDELKRKGFDLPELIRSTIDEVLDTKICPCCKTKIKYL